MKLPGWFGKSALRQLGLKTTWYSLYVSDNILDEDSYGSKPRLEVCEWLDEYVGENAWYYKILWLHNPVDGDIPQMLIYFPSAEHVTQFKLRWIKND